MPAESVVVRAAFSKMNGVAAMHTRLLKNSLFADFFNLNPDKFHNITNGVTPRRWIMSANPGLTNLIDGAIGHAWCTNLELFSRLEPLAEGVAVLQCHAQEVAGAANGTWGGFQPGQVRRVPGGVGKWRKLPAKLIVRRNTLDAILGR